MEDILMSGGILGILLALFLLFLAILWALLPFAVFGTKDRLNNITHQLEVISEQLQEMTSLLDPDRTKAILHAEYLAQQETAAAMEKERVKRERELEKLKEQQQKEAQQIAKSQYAQIECPACKKQVVIKDMRKGVKHECPSCHAIFTIT